MNKLMISRICIDPENKGEVTNIWIEFKETVSFDVFLKINDLLDSHPVANIWIKSDIGTGAVICEVPEIYGVHSDLKEKTKELQEYLSKKLSVPARFNFNERKDIAVNTLLQPEYIINIKAEWEKVNELKIRVDDRNVSSKVFTILYKKYIKLELLSSLPTDDGDTYCYSIIAKTDYTDVIYKLHECKFIYKDTFIRCLDTCMDYLLELNKKLYLYDSIEIEFDSGLFKGVKTVPFDD